MEFSDDRFARCFLEPKAPEKLAAVPALPTLVSVPFGGGLDLRNGSILWRPVLLFSSESRCNEALNGDVSDRQRNADM
jgi:hypothetical protein